ncbi:MAG: hypothetical protein H7Y37_07255 [Anaerolineae bacterium]|nr:hypothetical protein [Gloeobacterales cyanobacterium ES-bin-313]
MPGKRSKRSDTERFACPDCENRLWRIGSEKYLIYCSEASDFVHYMGMSRRQAAMSMAQGYRLDRHSWIEEFFCGEHGKMWLLVRNLESGKIATTTATAHDWKRSTGTPNPDSSNPSVSEFTQRMSRSPQVF